MFTEAEQAIRPGASVGPYQVLERLAVGGMAELFLARAVGLAGVERLVALKQILPGLARDPSFVEMFLNEARLASVLFHPNIVQTLDVGSAAGTHFIAMEYVHGRSLSKVLGAARDGGCLPLDCAVFIVGAVASALSYAHRQADARGEPLGIVHRDVSPSNVLVRTDGIIKLADFGIAKAVARSPKTRASVMKGKIGYMAPEQARSAVVDERTDVFALGILLYEVTTCARCFCGDSDFVILNKIVEGEYLAPSTVVENYPAALERIIARALQVRPEERYATARDFQLDLEAFAREAGFHGSTERVRTVVDEVMGVLPEPTLSVPTPADTVSRSVVARPDAEPRRRMWSGAAVAAAAGIGGALAAGGVLWAARAGDGPVGLSTGLTEQVSKAVQALPSPSVVDAPSRSPRPHPAAEADEIADAVVRDELPPAVVSDEPRRKPQRPRRRRAKKLPKDRLYPVD